MKEKKVEQIDFPIDIKADNSIAVIKKSFNKKIITASYIPYFKSFPFVISLVFSFLTLGYLGIQTYQSYSKIPSQIPLIYSQAMSLSLIHI